MAKQTFSFDIVSEVDLQEVDNCINQGKKELFNRYDFKGSNSSIEFNRNEKKITLITTDDFKLRALKDIILTKAVKRSISPKAFAFNEAEKVFGGNLKQVVDIATGIEKDRARELVKKIKDLGLKVQSQIEGEKVRVSAQKKDDLQTVMQHIRGLDFPIPLNFNNYR